MGETKRSPVEESTSPWDRIVDVVVVGSGGAALVAATMAHDAGSEVLIVEKAALLGGTSAVSGGGVWLPCNHKMAEAGIPDDRASALEYLERVTMGRAPDPELLEVFVDTAPEMLRYLEDHTPLRMHISPMPDYYSPWGIPGQVAVPGRAVEADPYPVGSELPDWADRIVKRGTLMSLGAATTLSEDFAPRTPELEAELARRTLGIDLEDGDLLVMAGETQRFWEHRVAKDPQVRAERLNLTFRRFRPERLVLDRS